MLTPIHGRSVVVTGGTKGIGKGIARVFAKQGAHVLLTGRDEAAARTTCDELNALGNGTVSYVLSDVADRSSCDQVAATAIERHGGIDVLCANAGIFPDAKLSLDALTTSGRGRIILTSSITGPITGYPGWSHYGASKAAQLGFMRTAAVELAPRGITVNAVLPGNVATEGLADLGDDYRRSMEMSIPMRQLGDVEDIGNACLYFASDEARYVTGQALVVDGGQVLPESLAALEAMD